jgi:hypothetical protein
MRRLWIGLVAALALAGAAFADRLSPVTLPLPPAAATFSPGTVWACPILKGANTRGWIHLANAGPDVSVVRITFVPDGAPPVAQAVTVEAGRAISVGAPDAVRQAAGAIVEAAGGDVTVSRTAFAAVPPNRSGAGAAACQRPDAASVVVPFGSTLAAETQIAMLNPGTSDAVVDVAFAFDGQRLAPETLRGRVVPARGRLVVRAGDFAFDEPFVAAIIQARSGRVVAEGLLTHGGFLELVPGGPVARSLVALGSSARGAAGFATVAVGDADAVIEARILSTGGQSAFEPLAAGLPPDTPKVTAAPANAGPAGPVALAIESATSGVAVAASWQVSPGPGTAEQVVTGGVVPSRRATAVLGVPATPGSMRILLAASDVEAAVVDITLMTETGPLKPPELTGIRVEPGRTALLGIPSVPATSALGVLATSAGGRFVAVLEATATFSGLFGAYAAVAVPAIEPSRVGVEIDPRSGIPAA